MGLEAELVSLRDKTTRMEMECKILHDHIRELEVGRREDKRLIEEMRVQSIYARAGPQAQRQPPEQPRAQGKQDQQVHFRVRTSVQEIDNCVTGIKAKGVDVKLRSVKGRVPTAFEPKGGSSTAVSFEEGDEEAEDDEAQQETKRLVKARTPTGFAHNVVGEDDDEDEQRQVRIQSEGQAGARSTTGKRVPTAFVKYTPDEDEEEDNEPKVRIQSEGQAGLRSTSSRRVPTAFAKYEPDGDEDEEDDEPKVRIQSEGQAGVRSTNSKRVPTAFAKYVPDEDEDDEDDDEPRVRIQSEGQAGVRSTNSKRVPTAFAKYVPDEDEEDDEPRVRIQSEGQAGARSTNSKRVPTAFAKYVPPDDEDEEDDEPHVRILSEDGVGVKSTNSKRVPTAFAKYVPDDEEDEEPRVRIQSEGQAGARSTNGKRVPTAFAKYVPDEDDDEDEAEEGAPRVRIQEDGQAGQRSTAKKRVPTKFAPLPRAEDDGEDEGGGGAVVRFQVGQQGAEGKPSKKVRVPTSFAPPPREDSEEDEEAPRRVVKINTQNSEVSVDDPACGVSGERAKPVKTRVPTAFVKSSTEASVEDDDQSDARSYSSKATRFSEVLHDSDSDDDGGAFKASCRSSRGRLPTAFVKTGAIQDVADESESPVSPGTRARRARMPEAIGRRASEEFDCGVSQTTSENEYHHPNAFDAEVHRVYGVEKDTELILSTLRALGMFQECSDLAVTRLAEEMEVYELPDKTLIAQQGNTKGTHFFVVEEGNFEVTRDGKRVAMVARGGLLGESVLVLSGAQNATVYAQGRARAYGMTGVKARMCLQSQYQDGKKDVTTALSQVLKCTESCKLLQNLTHSEEQILYDKAATQHFAAGMILQEEGSETIDSAHVLLRGILQIEGPDGEVVREVPRFGVIGDIALAYGRAPYTVRCSGPTQTLVLTKQALDQMFGERLKDRISRSQICDILVHHEEFKVLGAEQIEAAVSLANVVDVAPGSAVREESLNLVLGYFGSIEVQATDHEGAALLTQVITGSSAEAYGKDRLQQDLQPWAATLRNPGPGPARVVVWRGPKLSAVIALSARRRPASESAVDPVTPSVARETMPTRSPSMRLAVLHDDKVGALRKVIVLKTLSDEQLQGLAAALRVEYMAAGDTIFSQGDDGEEFFIIHSGLLEVFIGDRKIRNLGVGDYVGERALLQREPRSASVYAKEDSELWSISATHFLDVVKGPILEYMRHRMALQDTKVAIDDLKTIRVVGRGGYGVVKMVQSTKTNVRYALKAVGIQHAVEAKQQQNLVAERSILAELDHPFVIKFIRTFKSVQYVYFLMELVTGGELLDALQVLGLLNRKQAQFYVGSIVLALEFLHERRIAYLDLKGENCLLDQHGYLKMVDFGVAERVVDGKIFVTRGTCYYMAPEVILPVKGYNTTADLWSLGVVAFDFMTGQFPFANQITDPGHPQAANQILTEILKKSKKPVKFPNPKALDRPTQKFIQGLLQHDPQTRLGQGGFGEIKNHDFFHQFSWDNLLARQLQPPYIAKKEVYAEDAPEPKEGQDLPTIEDKPNQDGVIEPPVDPDPSWVDEFG